MNDSERLIAFMVNFLKQVNEDRIKKPSITWAAFYLSMIAQVNALHATEVISAALDSDVAGEIVEGNFFYYGYPELTTLTTDAIALGDWAAWPIETPA